MADGKIDTLDVGALERSVNDSAGRVSGIWLSFVAFSAYLAAAASMISHRQIFLEEPIKLPTINIDLPLVASAILLPLLYVTYHIFVLLQVVLLARTADAYNEAVAHSVPEPADSTRLRQRLANTLFAQLFAGSPREREGVLGWLLRGMAWVTLAIAPVFVLILFEVKLLPFHSAGISWTHRGLIALDLLIILLLWAGAVDARRDIVWQALIRDPKTTILAAFIWALSCVFVTFPGEPGRAWMRLLPSNPSLDERLAECALPTLIKAVVPAGSDRLQLIGEDFVDDDKLEKVIKAGNTNGQKPFESERTRSFRGRDLRCGQFAGADLRRADFSYADLSGALFRGAHLEGTTFSAARLYRATLDGAQLQGSFFAETRPLETATSRVADIGGIPAADLRSASLRGAQLQGAHFDGADLQEADLGYAQLEKASLRNVNLQDSHLDNAQLQQADLQDAQLQRTFAIYAQFQQASMKSVKLHAANLERAQFQGAVLEAAEFQGATLTSVQFQGADLNTAHLEGVSLEGASLQGANLRYAHMQGANLTRARLDGAALGQSALQGTKLDFARLRAANLYRTSLQASSLEGAMLQTAALIETQMQGAVLKNAALGAALLQDTFLWRVDGATCGDAQVVKPRFDQVVQMGFGGHGTGERPVEAAEFIEDTLRTVPDGARSSLRSTLQSRLAPGDTQTDLQEAWKICVQKTESLPQDAYLRIRVGSLVELACADEPDQKYISEGIYRNWIAGSEGIELSSKYVAMLATGMLKPDTMCPGGKYLDEKMKADLRKTAEREN